MQRVLEHCVSEDQLRALIPETCRHLLAAGLEEPIDLGFLEHMARDKIFSLFPEEKAERMTCIVNAGSRFMVSAKDAWAEVTATESAVSLPVSCCLAGGGDGAAAAPDCAAATAAGCAPKDKSLMASSRTLSSRTLSSRADWSSRQRRIHRLRTEESLRPGKSAAILRHLHPCRLTPSRIF